MNALIITLWAGAGLRLPLSYQTLIQGALYAHWRDAFPTLHDQGYQDGTRSFRMFTFSPLQGHYRAGEGEIVFDGAVSFEVRSPAAELIETLADGLSEAGSLRLGSRELPIIGLSAADRLLFFSRAKIRMLAPVTVHLSTGDGKSVYYSPTEEGFPELIVGNLGSKLRAAGLDAPPILRITPIERTLRKRVSLFKGIYITGWLGMFWLEASPDAMSLLYYAGLGDRNSQGFGMFAIENTPPA